MDQVAHSFHIKNLGRKFRKFIARCDTCQRVKYLNKSYTTQERSYLPARPGDLCALDLIGALPVARGGVRYILVCYDVFSKHVKLYALKAATTRSCLNKLVNHYFTQVIKPKCILSDNGTQFQSPSWRKKLAEHNVQVRFTPIRHPQANPSERCIREISKFCKIYCSQNHRKWAELLPKIEEWLNTTVADSTGFTPVEMLFQVKKPDLFEKILKKSPENLPEPETIGDKVMKAYARMRKKAKD
jgi:transposase InsO family protein